MTDIVAFLNARLDEEQRIADDSQGGPWWIDQRKDHRLIGSPRDPHMVVIWEEIGIHKSTPEHIATWNPARVLAEIATKRAILAEHTHGPAIQQDHGQTDDFGCRTCHNDVHCGETIAHGWCDTVRLMAAVYADHSDFDGAWRV